MRKGVTIPSLFALLLLFGALSIAESSEVDLNTNKLTENYNAVDEGNPNSALIQSLGWDWVTTVGESTIKDMDMDSHGNIYAIGSTNSGTEFGNITVESTQEGCDFHVSKIDPSGNWIWAKCMDLDRWGGVGGIAVSQSDDIYITGHFEGEMYYADEMIQGVKYSDDFYYSDIFVAKLNPEGEWIWVVGEGVNAMYDQGNAIDIDQDGNLYILGEFAGYTSANFGVTSFSSAGLGDIFIAKMDSEGNWIWAKRAGGSSTNGESANCVTVDLQGNAYVTGQFADYFYTDNSNVSLVQPNNRSLFVAKIDTNGNWQWVKSAGTEYGFDYGWDIHVNSDGDSIVTGFLGNSTAYFGEIVLNSTESNFRTKFVAKIDSKGDWLWANVSPIETLDQFGKVSQFGIGITLDSTNNILVGGSTISYFSQNGGWLWDVEVNSTTTSKILVNNSGHIYAGGYFTESTKFGNYEFENEGLYFGILSKDSDLDGAGDNSDAFPNNPNETTDTDGDGVGDNSDFDPYDPNESIDSDGDGVGDNSDVFPSDSYESIDSDGDGVGDNSDIFPNDSNETVDTDRDGVGDNSDAFPNNPTETADADGDGVGDNSDAFPNNPDETVDTDGDGVGDKSDYAPDDAGIQQFSDYIDIDIEIVFLGLCIIVLAIVIWKKF